MPPLISIDYNSPTALRAFLDSRDMGMRKKFGQNFLINPDARKRLLDALELNAAEPVWEIGPGLGAMTAGLLERGARLTAFEIDAGFSRALKEIFGSNENFTLVEGDVLKTWPKTTRENDLCLFGNLPYNIAAVLLADFIEKNMFFKKIVVTVQRETAQRFLAEPGGKDYSSISVLCSAVYKIRPLAVIKGASFYPVPRVDSQGLRFELLPDRKDFPRYFTSLLRSLFVSRRKTVQNNLSVFVSSIILKRTTPRETTPGAVVKDALDKAGICGNRRAETMTPADFINLAKILEDLLDHGR